MAAECYSDTKHYSATGNLNFYYGAFRTDSISGSRNENKTLFKQFQGEAVKSGHRRTFTDVGLPRNLTAISRPTENSSQTVKHGGLARDVDPTRWSKDHSIIDENSRFGDQTKMAVAGMLRGLGDNLKIKPKSNEIDQSNGYGKSVSKLSSSQRNFEKRETEGDLVDEERENHRKLKENTSATKIRSIPRPQGAIVNPGDDYVPGRTIKPENSNGWGSTGVFASKNLDRDRIVEDKGPLMEGESRMMEPKSLSSTGGISDERPPQNQRTRLRTRNLSEGNFSRYFAGEDVKNTSNERKIHVGSPSRSKSWNTLALSNNRSALGSSGGGMYTGESSRWGTGSFRSYVREDSPPSPSLYKDASYAEPSDQLTSSQIVSTQLLTSKSNGTEDPGNQGHSKAGDASDAKISGHKYLTDGSMDVKDSFANAQSNSSTDQRLLSTKGLIVGNSFGRVDARSSLDANLPATKANPKQGDVNGKSDHSTSFRFPALNASVHSKQENLPSKTRSDQYRRVNSLDGVFGNISNTNTVINTRDQAEQLKKMGNEKYKRGRFAEALTYYDRAISLAPEQASYHSNKAAALSALGRLVNAVQECQEAIRLDPSYARARRRLASLFLRLGQLDDAKKYFNSSEEHLDAGDLQQIRNIEEPFSRCLEARKVPDWRTLLRESDAAILAGADSSPKILALKAEALINLNRQSEAKQLLSAAQRLETDLTLGGYKLPDSTVSMVQAQLHMSQGRYQEALITAEKAAHIHSKDLEVLKFLKKLVAIVKARNMGNQLFKEGKYFEACAAYVEGLEVDPKNAVLLCNRAACRFSIGLWEKSIEDCDAALAAQPTYIKARLRRAHSYAKLERWEEALRDFEAVKRELPGNVDVAQALFDAQVQLCKARGEKVSKTHFRAEVQRISGVDQFIKAITSPGLAVALFIIRGKERCEGFLPFVDLLCQRYPSVNFLTVDIEEIPYLAKSERVADVPTLKIYRNGQKLQELTNSSHQDLQHALQSYTK